MFYSHPTPIALTCQLISISRASLQEIGSIYYNIWIDRTRVDIFRAAYLSEWLRRNQNQGEPITQALKRLLASVHDQRPDCLECGRFAHGVFLAARRELGITDDEFPAYVQR